MLIEREEMELTALPLHCTHVSQQCWLTTKLMEGIFPCSGTLSSTIKMSLAAESRRCDNLAKHLSEQRRLVSARIRFDSHEKRKGNHLARFPLFAIRQVSATRQNGRKALERFRGALCFLSVFSGAIWTSTRSN